MTSSNRTNNDSDESIVQHMTRATKNCLTRCFGGIQSSDERAKIKVKEYQMTNRKKQFGVDYMTKAFDDNANNDTTREELDAIVEKCKADLAKDQKEIDDLQAEIDRVNRETESKIQKKPTPAPATTAPAAATSSNPNAPAPAPAAAASPTLTSETPAPVAAPATSTTTTDESRAPAVASAPSNDVVPAPSSLSASTTGSTDSPNLHKGDTLAAHSSDSGQATTESI